MALPSELELGPVLRRALLSPVNLVVVLATGAGAWGLHSAPLAALGAVGWLSLVAWDVVSAVPRSVQKAVKEPPRIEDPDASGTLRDVERSRQERERVMGETPREVTDHLAGALVSLGELEESAERLAARADDLFRYLRTVDRKALDADIARLSKQIQGTRDAEARAEYERALAARQEQLRTLTDLQDARERVLASMQRVAATLGGFPSRLVRMRALDAQAIDAAGGDLSRELDRIGADVQAVERTVQAVARMQVQ